jgi:hypothetical protein
MPDTAAMVFSPHWILTKGRKKRMQTRRNPEIEKRCKLFVIHCSRPF